MKRKRYTDEQIAYALRQAEAGTPIKEVCRKLGVSEQTFYTWRRKFAGWVWPNCGSYGSCAMRTGS